MLTLFRSSMPPINNLSSQSSSKQARSSHTAAVAGGCVAGFVILIVLSMGWCMKRRRKRRQNGISAHPIPPNSVTCEAGTSSDPVPSTSRLQELNRLLAVVKRQRHVVERLQTLDQMERELEEELRIERAAVPAGMDPPSYQKLEP